MNEAVDIRSRTLVAVAEPPGGDSVSEAARVAFAAEAARLAGALGAETHLVTCPPEGDCEPDSVAAALAAVAAASADPAVGVAASALVAVLVQDGDRGRQLAPLVARRLGTGAVLTCSDAQARQDGLTITKAVHGGWLEQEVRAASGFVPVVTLDLTGLEPPEAAAAQAAAALSAARPLLVSGPQGGAQGAALGDAAAPALPAPRVRILETLPPDARSVDLVHAKRVVTAGMGVAAGAAGEQLMAAVAELADLLEGSVGATRPVVDEGMLSKERLIGQTGRTVTPDLYVALGVSGSPHHVAGVRRADRVLAINRDVRAPIFQFSDVGYVADLLEVLPALIDRIKEWRDAPGCGGAATGGHPAETGSGGGADVQ